MRSFGELEGLEQRDAGMGGRASTAVLALDAGADRWHPAGGTSSAQGNLAIAVLAPNRVLERHSSPPASKSRQNRTLASP
jgi:hypothetical protein